MRHAFSQTSGLIISILILLSATAEAQQHTLLSKSQCNSWRGSEIAGNVDAMCFSAEGVIQHLYVDSANSVVYALIRESKKGKLKRTGNIVAYNFHEGRELWNAPFDFNTDIFFLGNGIPVLGDKYYTSGIDRESGSELWRVALPIGLVVDGSVSVTKDYKALVGIDLHTGDEIWRRPINKFIEIESFEIYGDTVAVFLSSGLNYINLNTGEGFKVRAQTLEVKPPQVGSVGAVAVGAVLGGIIGGAIASVVISVNTSPGSAKHRADVSLSEFYMHEEGIIFTSKTEFFNVDFNGEIIWSMPVEKAIGVVRKVFVVDEAAYLISKGMINTQNGPIYSDAVLYRMNLNGTGSIVGIQLNTGKREYVQDFIVKDSTIVVVLNNKLVEIALSNLRTIQEQSFGEANQNAGFGAILSPPAIIFSDSKFEMAAEKHPDDFFVANKAGMKIRFSDELSPVEVIREASYFALSKKITAESMFVSNGSDNYLIDSGGEKLSEFSFSPQMQYVGGWVFDYEDNRIMRIKL